jgi:uncharacterized repeat protein (TIGR04076 family)
MVTLHIQVHEKKGNCPIFEVGDEFFIDNFWLRENQDKICAHALPTILHYFIALREGISPVKMGLSKDENTAFIQCPDCGIKLILNFPISNLHFPITSTI